MTTKIHQNEYIKNFIIPCVSVLYKNESMLFKNDLSERCIVFRLAHFLQNKFNESSEYSDYFIDCDYNSSTFLNKESGKCERIKGKRIEDREGDGSTGRFIDIIVHKRTCNENNDAEWSDLICFEIKKWNNDSDERIGKDINNLRILTSQYGYKYGFHLILGKNKSETTIEIFHEGESISSSKLFS